MTVGELIEQLKEYGEGLPVYVDDSELGLDIPQVDLEIRNGQQVVTL